VASINDPVWVATYAHLFADLDDDTRRKVIVRIENGGPVGYAPTEIAVRRHIRAELGAITPWEEFVEAAEWFRVNRRLRAANPQPDLPRPDDHQRDPAD
jgi:hypothetical protein